MVEVVVSKTSQPQDKKEGAPRVVSPRLVRAYRGFISHLPFEQRGLVIMRTSEYVVTREGLADHMEADDAIGQAASDNVLRSAAHRLRQRGAKNPTHEETLEEVVRGFRDAAEELVRNRIRPT